MSLARVTVKRPVATSMVAVAAFIFGLLSLGDVPLDLLPDLSYPAITIEVPFAGASPQEVETLLVRPVEDAVAVSQGLVRLRSTAQGGLARVALLFRWGTDMSIAALEVREKLQQVSFPEGAGAPRVLRFDPTLDPILRFAVTLPGASEPELVRLRRMAEDRLKPSLERLEGVAAARVRGGFEEEILVWVDPKASVLEQVTLEEIGSRLSAENINLAGGVLREGRLEYRVRTLNELRDLDDVAETVIGSDGDARLRLRQVAQVVRGTAERELVTRLGGREAIEVAVYKASGQNTVAVAAKVQEQLKALQAPGGLLAGAKVVVTADQSFFIRSALDDLASAASVGGVLAILVLLLFLHDLRATLIIAFTIPLSIVVTFLLMRGLDISLNVMSLGGIALAIGMLVDNAIVVLEAIAARRDEGGCAEPAVEGTGLVSRAVIASTLTTLSVFVPVAFVDGVASRLFTDQALTLTMALLASLVASLSVIPMLAATTLLQDATTLVGKGVLALLLPLRVPFQFAWDGLQQVYPRILDAALRAPIVVLLAATVASGAAWVGARGLGADFLPEMHPGLIGVEISLPQGSALRQTDLVLARLAGEAERLPEVQAVFSTAGAIARPGEQDLVRESVGQLLLRLQPGLGLAGEEAAIDAVRLAVAAEPGLGAPVFSRPGLVSVRAPLEVIVDGRDLDGLRDFAESVGELVAAVEGVIDVRNSARGGRPELRIALDRSKLALYDLDAASVSRVLETAVRGKVSTDLVRSDREVPIRVLLTPEARSSGKAIERIVVSPSGRTPITLGTVGSVTVGEGPAEIRREGQRRVAVISAHVSGVDLGSAAAAIETKLADLNVPPGLSVRLGGSAADMEQAFDGLAFAGGLALLLVYLILAAQFESFVHPLIIMGAVPLAGAGAVVGLLMTGTPVSVVVLIGGVVLAGIVVNNAILLVDRMNQVVREGMTVAEGVRRACKERLRPIVMTTATTVLGLLPLALAAGEGAEVRAPLAITVVSGLLGATLLTLVVVPCAYALLGKKKVAVEPAAPEPESSASVGPVAATEAPAAATEDLAPEVEDSEAPSSAEDSGASS
jgi:hydrophobic/amphiphilic exporter-1 (mainly G- bacteria), HAE1 family